LKIVFQIIGGIILLLALLAGLALATGHWRLLTATFFGTVDAEVRIESGANRINSYEAFFQACSAARQVEGTIDAQRGLLEATTDPDAAQRVRVTIAGLEARRMTHLENYNRMAAQETTTARFQADNLPERLATGPYTDNKTACGL
jgi:hypothetical protein